MTEIQDVRYRPDGSLDFEYYADRAAMLRSETLRGMGRRRTFTRIGLTAAAAIAGIVVAMAVAGDPGYCPGCAPASAAAMPGEGADKPS